MKLRTFLLVVVCLTLVPLLVVAGLAIWWAHQDERRAMEQALLYHARSLTVAVDREVETSLAGLRGLAASGDLDSGDLRKFYEQARLAREAYRRWLTVALVDSSGQQRLNLLHPLGSPLPSVGDLENFRRTVQTGEPQVSDLVVGPSRRHHDLIWRGLAASRATARLPLFGAVSPATVLLGAHARS